VINDRRGQAGRSSMSALPRKRTNDGEPRTSALCQKPTYAVQQTVPLFNYLIGDCEHVGWDAEPKRPGGLQVDDEVIFRRQRDWQIGRFRTLEDAAGIDAYLAI